MHFVLLFELIVPLRIASPKTTISCNAILAHALGQDERLRQIREEDRLDNKTVLIMKRNQYRRAPRKRPLSGEVHSAVTREEIEN